MTAAEVAIFIDWLPHILAAVALGTAVWLAFKRRPLKEWGSWLACGIVISSAAVM